MGLCQTLGLSAADRDDAAAETFAIAYRGLEHFRGDAELTTWLYRIAYRTAIKVRRRYTARGTGGAGGVEGAEGMEREDVKGIGPGEMAEVHEGQAAVWAAVGKLEVEQAAVVEMFYRRGMGVEEVAKVLEKPVGTVKTLLFRARERLRFLLKGMEHRT